MEYHDTGWYYIDGLVQDCSNSIANALELLQSCTKSSICTVYPIKYAHGFVVFGFFVAYKYCKSTETDYIYIYYRQL